MWMGSCSPSRALLLIAFVLACFSTANAEDAVEAGLSDAWLYSVIDSALQDGVYYSPDGGWIVAIQTESARSRTKDSIKRAARLAEVLARAKVLEEFATDLLPMTTESLNRPPYMSDNVNAITGHTYGDCEMVGSWIAGREVLAGGSVNHPLVRVILVAPLKGVKWMGGGR
jgi:hypothetical protein